MLSFHQMSRLVVLVLITVAASSVCGEKAKHCQSNADCTDQNRATVCSEGLCLQPCMVIHEYRIQID